MVNAPFSQHAQHSYSELTNYVEVYQLSAPLMVSNVFRKEIAPPMTNQLVNKGWD